MPIPIGDQQWGPIWGPYKNQNINNLVKTLYYSSNSMPFRHHFLFRSRPMKSENQRFRAVFRASCVRTDPEVERAPGGNVRMIRGVGPASGGPGMRTMTPAIDHPHPCGRGSVRSPGRRRSVALADGHLVDSRGENGRTTRCRPIVAGERPRPIRRDETCSVIPTGIENDRWYSSRESLMPPMQMRNSRSFRGRVRRHLRPLVLPPSPARPSHHPLNGGRGGRSGSASRPSVPPGSAGSGRDRARSKPRFADSCAPHRATRRRR